MSKGYEPHASKTTDGATSPILSKNTEGLQAPSFFSVVSAGVIFHMLKPLCQNAFKAILSKFRHFYFFPLWLPPPPSHLANTWKFSKCFGFYKGKQDPMVFRCDRCFNVFQLVNRTTIWQVHLMFWTMMLKLVYNCVVMFEYVQCLTSFPTYLLKCYLK